MYDNLPIWILCLLFSCIVQKKSIFQPIEMFFLISRNGSHVFKHEIHCVKATIKQWKQQSKGIWLLGEPAVTCLHSLSLLIHGSALFIAQFSNTRCWLKLLGRTQFRKAFYNSFSDLLDPRFAHFINSYFLCVFWRLVIREWYSIYAYAF